MAEAIRKLLTLGKNADMWHEGMGGCKILLAPVNRFSKFSFAMSIRLALLLLYAVPALVVARESAQPVLPVTLLRIGSVEVRAEVADEDPEREAGLMFREALGEDAGMLFVMPATAPATFWMKNTLIPLSIAFIGPDGTILEIHDMEPKSEKITRSTFPRVSYALEMSKGWYSKRNIWPGDRVTGLPPPPK